ncbi:MAG: response regulator [Anaerolineae bacterium]|nr:response regulator [Anaerolineae bacterium]
MANILVVEDHPLMRPTLCDLLKLEGYGVVMAAHGREALDLLKDRAVDLVVTDCVMPELDGIGLVRQLRANKQYEALPILMFTANEDPSIQGRALEVGATAFLVRPITVAELLGTIQKLLAPSVD